LKVIEQNPNYSITEDGRVYSHHRGIYRALSRDKYGYITTALHSYGIRKMAKVHRLVAGAYIPNPENKPCVNHIDGDKANNHVSNLEWCTQSENNLHAYKIGLKKGYRKPKLNEMQVRIIRRLKGQILLREAAKIFGVSFATISMIQNNKTWN